MKGGLAPDFRFSIILNYWCPLSMKDHHNKVWHESPLLDGIMIRQAAAQQPQLVFLIICWIDSERELSWQDIMDGLRSRAGSVQCPGHFWIRHSLCWPRRVTGGSQAWLWPGLSAPAATCCQRRESQSPKVGRDMTHQRFTFKQLTQTDAVYNCLASILAAQNWCLVHWTLLYKCLSYKI